MTSHATWSFLESEVDNIRAARGRLYPPVLSGVQGPETLLDGRQVINLASNNYLGLSFHPELIEAAIRATETYGVGAGAVRIVTGTMDLHRNMEQRLAAFKGTEASVVYQSGFTANAGTVAALLGPDDLIVSDQLNHASIIDGARLSKAQIKVFSHADPDAAQEILRNSTHRRRLLVTDGVFSMDGDIAPLPALSEVAERYDAILMVDDAHSSGVLGSHGRGTVDHFGLEGRVPIQIGTLSKALGLMGGYAAGDQILASYLLNRARPFVFSTGHPPAVAAACIAALDILERDTTLVDRLWDNTRYFQDALRHLGYDLGRTETPITPILLGEEERAVALSRDLYERGVYAPSIAYPIVPRGAARLRLMISAMHERDHLDRALEVFQHLGRRYGVDADRQ
ncbi:MAG: glycine C-acetyltransferase [Chloroflexota bacterium]